MLPCGVSQRKGGGGVAEKLPLRERARIALGDFGYTEETLRAKMADIYEQDAKERGEDDFSIALHRAVIMRDGNIDAFETKAQKPAAVSSDEAARKDHSKNGEITKAPERGLQKTQRPAPEPEKRKRGRPHKHKAAGGQFSVWLPDETKKRLQVLAASEGISAGELAARFIEAGLLKKGE